MFSLKLPQSVNRHIPFSFNCLVLNMSKDIFSNPDCYEIACHMGCLFLNHAFLNERSQMPKNKSFFSYFLGNYFSTVLAAREAQRTMGP